MSITGKSIPILHRRIFWDVDFDAKAAFIITRVFNRGDVEDIRQCRRYYGDDRVRASLAGCKILDVAPYASCCGSF